jgi:hypothetical protein
MDALIRNSSRAPQELSNTRPSPRPNFRHWLEYLVAASILRGLGKLPRGVARGISAVLAAGAYCLWPRLRGVGLFNLQLSFPEWPESRRRRVLFAAFQHLGRMLADFAQFSRLTRDNIERMIVYDGFENYAAAASQGRGVLFLTAHFGTGSSVPSLMEFTVTLAISWSVRWITPSWIELSVESDRAAAGELSKRRISPGKYCVLSSAVKR